MFIDEVEVKLRAGDGGHGCVSFRREKFVPKGGPDGGDGGKGGDVILECDENTADLRTYYFSPHWEADNGRSGMGKQRNGRSGKDCVLKVPPGIVVHDAQTGEVVMEILTHGERCCLLHGGKGGLGNTHFKSSTNQAPRHFTEGKAGERGEFHFVLKTIADAGIVGYPNAGKSSLIKALTGAQPKTAAYPFTTLNPAIGVLQVGEERVKLADIPGLIEGAHANRGLGHKFLRHIERCAALLVVVDIAATEGRDPVQDYRDVLQELEYYKPVLLSRPRLVVANKIDEAGSSEHLEKLRSSIEDPVFPVSAILGEGLEELTRSIFKFVRI